MIQRKFNLLSILQLFSVLCITAISVTLAVQVLNVISASRYKTRSMQLIDELRESSEDLTWAARGYLTTGEQRYYDLYQTILDIRNGKTARPEDYLNFYWNTISSSKDKATLKLLPAQSLRSRVQEAGFTQTELEKIYSAEDASNLLAKTELNAFATVRGAPPSRAIGRGLLFDEGYNSTKKNRIMRPLAEARAEISRRTSQRFNDAAQKARICILALAAGLILLIFSTANFWRNLRALIVNRIIRLSSDCKKIRQTQGEFKLDARDEDEVGELARSFNGLMEQLNESKSAAESANQAKSAFLATMSHEIRTPLTGILGMLKLLEYTQLSEKQLEYVNKSHAATQALLGIINDILDYSKIEAGKLEVVLDHFWLDDLLEQVSAVFSANLKSSGLKLTFRVSPEIPSTLIGDALRIRQVLLNLIGNAIKFSGTGDTIQVTVSASQSFTDDSTKVPVEFSVRDAGIGIAPDKLNFIFDGFNQAESTTSRQYGGTGLGLAISKRIVALMGGDLKVESELGEGSRFFFSIPLQRGTPTSVKEKSAASLTASIDHFSSRKISSTLPLAGVRLLVVEDNPLNQQIARELLTLHGASVQVANSGMEGIEKILGASPKFDAILMDMQMPVMDGLECTRRLRTENAVQDIPIIAMTANATQTAKQACLEAGMNDYISKPIDMDQLLDTILKYVHRKTFAHNMAPGTANPVAS